MHFPGLEKLWIGLGKIAEVKEKSWNSFFGPSISCWKHSLCHRTKICAKGAGFSAFVSRGKF